MPINSYFDGNGEGVMGKLQQEYGSEKGKRVFYGIVNKKHAKPAGIAVPKVKRTYELGGKRP
jgi:hypothetical protein